MPKTTAIAQPTKLLKWAGSKSGISHRIVPHLRFDATYIEPFCGSAAFFFQAHATSAFLNDLNSDLIRFYIDIKLHYQSVFDAYSSVEVSEKEYYAAREEYNSTPPSPRKSGLFVYLNHYCFNGIYRTNKRGEFNTPFGAKTKVKEKLKIDDFRAAADILQGATLSDRDFEEFLRLLNPANACIYLDPPYFTDDERVFGEYGANTFKGSDLLRLAAISNELAKGNRVVVSYRRCTEFMDLFGKHVVAETNVIRNVGGFKGRRKQDTELIAIMDFRECAH